MGRFASGLSVACSPRRLFNIAPASSCILYVAAGVASLATRIGPRIGRTADKKMTILSRRGPLAGKLNTALTHDCGSRKWPASIGFAKAGKGIVTSTLALQLFVVQDAESADSSFRISAGAEYTSGEFGGTESIEEWYVPVTGKYRLGKYVFRLTVPYIRLTAPRGTTLVSAGPDGEVLAVVSGPRTTEDGLGDIISGVTYQDLFNTELSRSLAVDLTGKIKFGTADEDKGLGTGENDYTVQADVFRFFDRFMPFGTLGYKFRGDPPGIDLDDVWFGVIGGLYDFTPNLGGGLDFYYREASFPGGSEQQELTAHLSYRLSSNQRLQVYGLHGLSDGSPDWGGGVMVTFSPK